MMPVMDGTGEMGFGVCGALNCKEQVTVESGP